MDEPSMPKPSSNEDSLSCPMGYETWCHSPGISVKRRSRIWTLCSLTNAMTAFGSGLVSAILILLIATRALCQPRGHRLNCHLNFMERRASASAGLSRGAAQSSGVGILNRELHCWGKGRGRGRLPKGHTQEYAPPREVANTMF